MGTPTTPSDAVLILAAFSGDPAALAWAAQRSQDAWSPIQIATEPLAFDQTRYYEPSMGSGLSKVLWAYQAPCNPAQLADLKLQTNAWEEEYRQRAGGDLSRPLNLDPGYVTEAKLVLATTKDRDHRIYLRDGIYAEVTLAYRAKTWEGRPWTYPDYLQPAYHEFLDRARQFLRARRAGRAGRSGD